MRKIAENENEESVRCYENDMELVFSGESRHLICLPRNLVELSGIF